MNSLSVPGVRFACVVALALSGAVAGYAVADGTEPAVDGRSEPRAADGDEPTMNRVLARAQLVRWAQLGERGAAAAEEELLKAWGPRARKRTAKEAAAARRAGGPAVMLVTDGNIFLEKAIEMSPAVATADVVAPHRYGHERASGCDVVLFDRWRPPRLPENAHVIFFDELPSESDLAAAEERGARLRVEEVGVTAWQRDHPLLRGLDLKPLYATDALQLRVPPGAGWDVLVRSGERSLVVARPVERRWQIVVGFDPMLSNWPLQKSFFEFLHRSVEWLTGAAAADSGAGDAPSFTTRRYSPSSSSSG